MMITASLNKPFNEVLNALSVTITVIIPIIVNLS